MRERHPYTEEAIVDPYWGEDMFLGETDIGGERRPVHLKLHTSEQPARRRGAADLVPRASPSGITTYLHGQPYIHEPALRLEVAVTPHAPGKPDASIGTVTSSSWEGMRKRPIGNVQAWYYPSDRLLLFWECVLEDRVRVDNPLGDPLLGMIWRQVETLLHDRFPTANRIVTPSWEDLYEKVPWQQFLASQGYTSVGGRAFGKVLDYENRRGLV